MKHCLFKYNWTNIILLSLFKYLISFIILVDNLLYSDFYGIKMYLNYIFRYFRMWRIITIIYDHDLRLSKSMINILTLDFFFCQFRMRYGKFIMLCTSNRSRLQLFWLYIYLLYSYICILLCCVTNDIMYYWCYDVKPALSLCAFSKLKYLSRLNIL